MSDQDYICIDRDLLRQIERMAALEKRPIHVMVDELLRQALSYQERPPDYRLRLQGWKADLHPGISLFDRRTLFNE